MDPQTRDKIVQKVGEPYGGRKRKRSIDLELVGEMRRSGFSNRQVASFFGVSWETIRLRLRENGKGARVSGL